MPTSTSPSKTKATNFVPPLKVVLGGSELDPATEASKVIEIVVSKHRFVPDMAVVRIGDPQLLLIDSSRGTLGVDLKISAGHAKDTTPKEIFIGKVAAVEPVFSQNGTVAVFRAYDRSHNMMRRTRTRFFQDMTTKDIVSAIVGDHGLSLEATTPVSIKFESMMQANESDWDFVWRLAAQAGLQFTVEGTKAHLDPIGHSPSSSDAGTLAFSSDAVGNRLYAFRPRVSNANLPDKIDAYYMDANGTPSPGGQLRSEVNNGVPVTMPAHKLFDKIGEFEAPGATVQAPGPVVVGPEDMKERLKAAMTEAIAAAAEADGEAQGDPKLVPGATVEIVGVGRFSGKYVLSETTHVYRAESPYVTRFSVSSRARSLLAAVEPQPSRALGARDRPGATLVRAMVTSTKDPDKLGRVRVKYPVLEGGGASGESWWARIVSLGAGPNRGVTMLPHVGDRVLVGFENGDTQSPIVLGGLHEDKGAKPGEHLYHDPGKEKGSFAVQAAESIFLRSTKDHKVDVEQGGWLAKVAKNIEFETKNGDLVVKAKNITFEAMQNITINSKIGNIELKAAQSIKVGANMNLELKGTIQVTVGGGMIKLG